MEEAIAKAGALIEAMEYIGRFRGRIRLRSSFQDATWTTTDSPALMQRTPRSLTGMIHLAIGVDVTSNSRMNDVPRGVTVHSRST